MLTATDLIVLRRMLGYNRQQTAFLLDISYPYVSALEKGHKPMTVKVSDRIKERFDVTPERLECVKVLSKRYDELNSNFK